MFIPSSLPSPLMWIAALLVAATIALFVVFTLALRDSRTESSGMDDVPRQR